MIDHQENPNIELTRGGGGRIKEVEEQLVDDGFKGAGESTTTARLKIYFRRLVKYCLIR